VLHLIHACGLKALAEGIETQEQADMLREMGCGSGQGYYFGRPAPAAEVVALFSRAKFSS
jgi:EAL domain-containing protein (putative c-di-GMP-specific phosphodiesterase class I)